MKNAILSFALALAAIAVPATVHAERGEENRVLVEYQDLDLNHAAGRAALNERLDRAIKEVCHSSLTRSVRASSQARQCIAEKRAELAPVREAIITSAQRTDTGASTLLVFDQDQ